MKRKKIQYLFFLVCLAAMLTGCADLFPKSGQNAENPPATVPYDPTGETVSVIPEEWNVTVPETQDLSGIESLSMVVTEDTIRELDNYPNLRTLDLSGSTCYTAIMVYIQNHPQVDVTYTVDFGITTAISWSENISIPGEGVTFPVLRTNLVYLPNLKTLHLPRTTLKYSEIEALRAAYPNVEITYTVSFRGMEYGEDTQTVNLAGMTVEEITPVIGILEALPNLSYADLMTDGGTCELSRQDVKRLMEAAPDVRFHYVFTLFGRTVSTSDEEIKFEKLSLTTDAEAEIREAMSIMAPGSSLILDRCGLSSEFLDSIRQDYDDVDLVWRVYYGTDGRYTALTNATTIRSVYNVTDTTCSELRYVRSVKYIDMGHNDTLTDLSFIGYMPELEILILSGCAASDLSGFENCKKLTWLELAYCYKLKNIDSLSSCESLTYLNLSFTGISNYQPLDGLPLKRFVCLSPKANAKEQKTFVNIHPKGVCITVFYGYSNPYGYGWRYDDNGKTFNEYYKNVVRVAFNYDELEKYLPKETK